MSFKKCVIATHVPLQGRSSALMATLRQTKLAAYSTYAIGGVVPKERYPRALFWDAGDPYLYARFHASGQDDYVIVQKQDTARAGEIVVGLLEEEATVKYYQPRKDRVELVAANDKYAPIVVTEDADFRILGIVRGVVRSLGRS